MGRSRASELERILSGFVSQLRDIPFEIAVKGIYGKTVLPFNSTESDSMNLLNMIAKAMVVACQLVRKNPIDGNKRPNEVGNAMEISALEALRQVGLEADVPATIKGKKSAGYPDIVITYQQRILYLEVKTYNLDQLDSRLRSFYMSPSESPKVLADAHHLLVGFEMHKSKRGYMTNRFRLMDMYGVKTDFKAEINTSNPELYKSNNLLATGNFKKHKLTKSGSN